MNRSFYRKGSLLLGMAVFWGLLLLPQPAQADEPAPFEMLVVGDSHISGQGLREENKFYSLVRDWLQNDVFGTTRKVDLKVLAHAGARIELHQDELEKMQKVGDDINKFYEREANISSPSIRAQIDRARNEYKDPEKVELVMLSGCITDILVANTVNPFYNEKKLRKNITKYCNESMFGLLEHTKKAFPNAHVVVVGYFPIASKDTDVNTMTHYFLKILNLPPKLHFVFTNGLSRQPLKILRNKIAKRSALWLKESNRALLEAVERFNAKTETPSVLFVESPITDGSAFATKNTMLWTMGEDNLPNDETYADRMKVCSRVFGDLKFHHYGRLTMRLCELSSVAHPNILGAKAFATAIENKLESVLSEHIASRRRPRP